MTLAILPAVFIKEKSRQHLSELQVYINQWKQLVILSSDLLKKKPDNIYVNYILTNENNWQSCQQYLLKKKPQNIQMNSI